MPTITTRGAITAMGFGFGAQTIVSGNTYSWVFSQSSVSGNTFTVPSGVTSLTVEAIGSGGDISSPFGNGGAGGGGAYAKSVITVTPGQTIYYSVLGNANTDAWLNKSANSAPTSASNGVLAQAGQTATGATGGAGGSAGSSIGQTTYAGGAGGTSTTSTNSSGGGGSGGPTGAGKNGGGGKSNAGGGGGGAGGASSTSGGDGDIGVGKGGAGGQGPLGTGGGAGATSTTIATSGTNGGGGGGAYGSTGSFAGSGSIYDYWGGGYGPGSGAGGSTSTSFNGGYAGWFGSGRPGNGPNWGRNLVIVTFTLASAASETSVALGYSFTETAYVSSTQIAGVDSSGNIYVVCITGGNSASTPYNNTLIFAKISSTGSVVWARTINGISAGGCACVCDSSFNLYVVARMNLSSTNKQLILKYNSSGVLQWQRTHTLTSYSFYTPTSMDIDSSGNIWIAGYNGTYVILINYNSSGTLLSHYLVYYSSLPNLIDVYIKCDTSGYIYLSQSGYYYVGACCCYIVTQQYLGKYNLSGTAQWSNNSYGTQYNGYPFTLGITIDSSSNVYWGFIEDFYSRPTVAKFNSSGTLQFTLQNQLSAVPLLTAKTSLMAMDSSNNIYMAVPENSGASNLYKISSTGTQVYVKRFSNINASFGAFQSIVLSGSNLILSQNFAPSNGVAIFTVNSSSPTLGTFGPTTISNSTVSTTTASVTSTNTPAAWTTSTATSTTSTFTDSAFTLTSLVGVI